MQQFDFDVTIIGAGPAGSSCALAMENTGLKVLLIDQATFPRDKICGDAIPGPAFKVLDQINSVWGNKLRELTSAERIKSSVGYAPDGRSIRFDWKTFAFNSKRLDFDHFLHQLVRLETKTECWSGYRLQRTERLRGGFNCTLKLIDSEITRTTESLPGPRGGVARLSTRLIIGCDGANSLVARQLMPSSGQKQQVGSAVRRYYRGVAGLNNGVNEFYFLPQYPLAYFWIFPVGAGEANVGFGTFDGASLGKGMRAVFQDLLEQDPRLAPRFQNAVGLDKTKGFALPFFSKRRPISGDGFMLCGDAAALVSPLWGHGIDTAMQSGLLAARQVKAAFEKQDFSGAFLTSYDEGIHRIIGRNFQRAQQLLWLVQRFPILLKVFWWFLPLEKPLRWALKRLGWL